MFFWWVLGMSCELYIVGLPKRRSIFSKSKSLREVRQGVLAVGLLEVGKKLKRPGNLVLNKCRAWRLSLILCEFAGHLRDLAGSYTPKKANREKKTP